MPTKSNVKELVLGNHSFFRKQIDISHGIAFAECSPQPKRSMGRREMDYGKAKGAASFNNSLGLDYLPPSFYYRTGYIHWYLVKYDPMGKIARILPQDRRQLFSGPSSQDLLQLASPGDQMAGVWSF